MASRGVNKVILIGNVGRDPEIRHTQSNQPVANVSLATTDTWKDRSSGEQQERTEWHRLVFFGRLAEIVEQYVTKGGKLYVEGRLQTRSWEADGGKRYTTEVVVNEMQMLDSRGSSGGRDFGQGGGADSTGGGGSAKPAGGDSGGSSFDNFDDDIPF